jgi:transcriptional regulator with XRE-family HTH domain
MKSLAPGQTPPHDVSIHVPWLRIGKHAWKAGRLAWLLGRRLSYPDRSCLALRRMPRSRVGYARHTLRIAERTSMISQVSINVRFLLWSRKIARTEWEAWLATRVHLPPDVCGRLVRGTLSDAEISSDQIRTLADGLEVDEENLRFADLPRDRGNVLSENLHYLFGALGHGGKKAIASKLGIDPTTVSRWLSGAYEPQPTSLRQLASHFGLPSGTDLLEDPVFLSVEPISTSERKLWLSKRISALSADELRELFPALRRLLEER